MTQSKDLQKRWTLLMSARKFYNNRRLALVELDGKFSIVPVTGKWKRTSIDESHWEARESETPMLEGNSIQDLNDKLTCALANKDLVF